MSNSPEQQSSSNDQSFDPNLMKMDPQLRRALVALGNLSPEVLANIAAVAKLPKLSDPELAQKAKDAGFPFSE